MTANIDRNISRTLFAMCMAAFMVPFMASSLNLALPEISKTFSYRAVTLGWFNIAYALSTAIFQIPFAKVADMVGRKKVFMTGIAGFAVCTFLCSFVTSGSVMLGLRFLTGMCAAMIFGTNIAIIMSVVPQKFRARALGLNTAVVYSALALGPVLGGFIIYRFGWQSVFLMSTVFALAVLLMVKVFIRQEWTDAKGEKFDLIGSLIYGLSLCALIYGVTHLPSFMGFAAFMAGITGFGWFAFYEKKIRYPVFNIQLLSSNRVFALSSAATLINYSANAGTVFMVSLYLQYIKGFDVRTAGFIMISQAVVQSLCSLNAGRLSEKIEPYKLATLGMLITSAGLGGLSLLGADTPLWGIIICLILLGTGSGTFASPNVNVLMSSVESKYYGQASAATGTMRLTGHSFSMGIVAMILGLTMGNRQIVPEVYPQFLLSFKIIFIIFMLLCLGGSVASYIRVKPGKPSLPD